MGRDDEGDEDRPLGDHVPPPDDRLWRHPSEMAGGTPPPTPWLRPQPSATVRRSGAIVALASAALAGAVVALGVTWIARPTKVVVRDARPLAARAATTAAMFSPAVVPSQTLAKQLAPSLAHVQVARNDQWSSGTGVWIDRAGTVATTVTLVEGADEVVVTAPDGERLRATVTGTDAASGMATVKVTGPTGERSFSAEADDAEAGQSIAVIGAASTGDGTTQQRVVTAAVSAVGVRTTLDALVIHDAIQLDRSVPDDAVGAIAVDADGRAIGIVVAGAGDDGLAVLVPAAEALDAARGLRDDGTVHRAWLGVRAIDLTPSAAQLLEVPGGALLNQVEAGSPAAAAGLTRGDVVIKVDDRTISDASDLVVALRAWHPGERVAITWKRGTDTRSATITLGG